MRWIWNHSLRSLCFHSQLFVVSWPCTGHTLREYSTQAIFYAADLGQEACLGSRGCGCAHHVHPLHLKRSDPATLLPLPLLFHRQTAVPPAFVAALHGASGSSPAAPSAPSAVRNAQHRPTAELPAMPRVGTAAAWVRACVCTRGGILRAGVREDVCVCACESVRACASRWRPWHMR
jgi:hypothetical protein